MYATVLPLGAGQVGAGDPLVRCRDSHSLLRWTGFAVDRIRQLCAGQAASHAQLMLVCLIWLVLSELTLYSVPCAAESAADVAPTRTSLPVDKAGGGLARIVFFAAHRAQDSEAASGTSRSSSSSNSGDGPSSSPGRAVAASSEVAGQQKGSTDAQSARGGSAEGPVESQGGEQRAVQGADKEDEELTPGVR
jgi:hypothetical protein